MTEAIAAATAMADTLNQNPRPMLRESNKTARLLATHGRDEIGSASRQARRRRMIALPRGRCLDTKTRSRRADDSTQ